MEQINDFVLLLLLLKAAMTVHLLLDLTKTKYKLCYHNFVNLRERGMSFQHCHGFWGRIINPGKKTERCWNFDTILSTRMHLSAPLPRLGGYSNSEKGCRCQRCHTSLHG